MKQSLKLYIIGILVCITVAIAAWLILRPAVEDSGVEVIATDGKVESTKAVLDSIRSIGQWELMAIDVQADVDTTVERWFGLKHDHLQRRYYGRISLGIDMRQCKDLSNLPEACVLDSNFIDESRTELIDCDNTSDEQNSHLKAVMLEKARRIMLRDAATPLRLQQCGQKARDEIKRLTQ